MFVGAGWTGDDVGITAEAQLGITVCQRQPGGRHPRSSSAEPRATQRKDDGRDLYVSWPSG